ncbi:sensor histidine kinase [Nibricoccus sp. IMCC34717]|uniref:sensor histidine kinase n=1 Tax=Nibricoccus sp. IMCC34717 TaxID=3034021 RepID=UPI00384F446E
MAPAPRPLPTPLKLLGILAFWTLVGFAFASQLYLSSALMGRAVTWGQAISFSLADWYVWAVLSWPILVLARRWPPESPRPWRAAWAHLGCAIVASAVYVLLRSLVALAQAAGAGEEITFGEVFTPLLLKTFPFNFLIYGVIVSISHAIDYYRMYHERTVHALELEKHLAEARLQALLHQLKPHFLFNTLNGIASLMHRDVDLADRMLVRLSEVLRITMNQQGRPFAPLRDEIAFIEKYLEIERIRFGDRLAVSYELEPAALALPVPSLVLQPLVENAIKHGIEPHARRGRVAIGARITAPGRLELTVTDSGAGLAAGGQTREGIGTANTRARLRELFGEDQSFTLENLPEGGLLARLRLPFPRRRDPAPHPDCRR